MNGPSLWVLLCLGFRVSLALKPTFQTVGIPRLGGPCH